MGVNNGLLLADWEAASQYWIGTADEEEREEVEGIWEARLRQYQSSTAAGLAGRPTIAPRTPRVPRYLLSSPNTAAMY